jgi:hypothetical protein
MKNLNIITVATTFLAFVITSCIATERNAGKNDAINNAETAIAQNCIPSQLSKNFHHVTEISIEKRNEFLSMSFQEQLSMLDSFFDEPTKLVLTNSSKAVFSNKFIFKPSRKDLLGYIDKIAFYAPDAYGIKDCGEPSVIGWEIRTYLTDSIRSDLSFNKISDGLYQSATMCLGKIDQRLETTRVLAAYGMYKNSPESLVCKNTKEKGVKKMAL